MKKFLFLLFSSLLAATVNEPLRCELFSGYRNDRIHWHIQDPGEGGELIYSKLYRDLEYWENGLTLKVIHRDLTFFLKGSYGWLDTRWCADGAGYFGYAVNLTADRVYKVLLTPFIGYSGYFEQLSQFRLVWNGVFLGAGVTVETGRVILNAGYSYHFMHNRVRTHFEESSMRSSSGGNKGHTGWAQIDGALNALWRLGVGGQIHYFPTRVVDAHVQEEGRGDFSQKFKLRWTSVSAWAQVSRQF
jgi:hypothetical protein